VGVGVVDVHAGEPARRAAAPEEGVGVVEVMPALAQHGAAVFFADGLGGGDHFGRRGDFHAGEDFRLRDVGRRYRSKGQKFRLERFDGGIRNEIRAAGGHHYGVDDHILRPVLAELFRDDADEGGGRDHADLHGVGPDIGEHAVELLGQKFRGHFKDALHAGRILGGQGRDGAHGVYAVCGHGLDICLDAGASAGIASGDC